MSAVSKMGGEMSRGELSVCRDTDIQTIINARRFSTAAVHAR